MTEQRERAKADARAKKSGHANTEVWRELRLPASPEPTVALVEHPPLAPGSATWFPEVTTNYAQAVLALLKSPLGQALNATATGTLADLPETDCLRAADITGAGATFPAPIYAKWADAYNKATGVRINYQSVGSGAGLKQIKAKTVDFGSSDKPLSSEELAQSGLGQFPSAIGGVVPVVNENDTVAIDEIRLGDNDTLGALTVNLIEADLLVILTDQEGLFEADPRVQPDARLIGEADLSDTRLVAMAGGSKGVLGRGGMKTKLSAAQIAARSGAATVIAHGRSPDALLQIAEGAPIGTLLKPGQTPMAARKRWIAGQLQVRGVLHLDAGAAAVLAAQGRSLLPVGVTAVEGDFDRGDLVSCRGPDGEEIARGLVNYDADEARRIAGARREDITARLGYAGETELVHRDNLVVVNG